MQLWRVEHSKEESANWQN